MRPRALLSWSSGKDSAFALSALRERGDVDVVGLVTTFNEAAGRVAMHGVRRDLVEAQARAAGLPLWSVGRAPKASRRSPLATSTSPTFAPTASGSSPAPVSHRCSRSGDRPRTRR